MAYLLGNEAACRGDSELKKCRSQLSKDEVVVFLSKTERKKCKNT